MLFGADTTEKVGRLDFVRVEIIRDQRTCVAVFITDPFRALVARPLNLEFELTVCTLAVREDFANGTDR